MIIIIIIHIIINDDNDYDNKITGSSVKLNLDQVAQLES